METKRWLLYLPPFYSEDGFGAVVKMPENAGMLQGVLDRLDKAERGVEENRRVIDGAPAALSGGMGRMSLLPLDSQSCFAAAAETMDSMDAMLDREMPAIESTGRPFDPGHAQAVTAEEAFGALNLAEEGTFWDAGPANGCVQHLTLEKSGGCGYMVDVPMVDEPEFAISAGAPLAEIREALAPVLQAMKEAEAQTEAEGPRP